MVNFDIFDVTDWRQQIITIHILPNISSKIFFLKNHTQNVDEKLVPELFIKNQN